MATITINVKLTPAGVVAQENPGAARLNDTVTWVFDSGPDDLHVVFKKVELSNGELLIAEQGPFSTPLSRSGKEISGTIAPDAPGGRYLYDIRDGKNQRLTWANPLSPGQNFGGLDIPKPPPRSPQH
jgi:hypothetical protein